MTVLIISDDRGDVALRCLEFCRRPYKAPGASTHGSAHFVSQIMERYPLDFPYVLHAGSTTMHFIALPWVSGTRVYHERLGEPNSEQAP